MPFSSPLATTDIQKLVLAIKGLWNEASQDFKRTVKGSRNQERDRRTARKINNVDIIRCPQSLERPFRVWKETPKTFLTYPESTAHIQEKFELPELYLSLKGQSQSNEVNRIRWRFCLLLFNDWKKSFCDKRLRIHEDEFVDLILHSGLVTDDRQEVTRQVKLWGAQGKRYERLVQALGSRGALLLLPDEYGTHE